MQAETSQRQVRNPCPKCGGWRGPSRKYCRRCAKRSAETASHQGGKSKSDLKFIFYYNTDSSSSGHEGRNVDRAKQPLTVRQGVDTPPDNFNSKILNSGQNFTYEKNDQSCSSSWSGGEFNTEVRRSLARGDARGAKDSFGGGPSYRSTNASNPFYMYPSSSSESSEGHQQSHHSRHDPPPTHRTNMTDTQKHGFKDVLYNLPSSKNVPSHYPSSIPAPRAYSVDLVDKTWYQLLGTPSVPVPDQGKDLGNDSALQAITAMEEELRSLKRKRETGSEPGSSSSSLPKKAREESSNDEESQEDSLPDSRMQQIAVAGSSFVGGQFIDDKGSLQTGEFFIWNNDEFENMGELKNFRMSTDSFIPSLVEEYQRQKRSLPCRDGMESTRISGSGQYGTRGAKKLKKRIQADFGSDAIVTCDLRGEPHCILNGMAVSWFNKGDKIGEGLGPVQVDELNRRYIESIKDKKSVEVYHLLEKENGYPIRTKFTEVNVESVQTEEMLIHRDMGMGYMRIPITDHEMPEEHEVDMLVAFYHSAPSAVWWHFHCAAGRGRTTTAMVIIDMLRNRHRHPHLTLQDFLRRQHLIGGLDLENVSSDPAKAWKRQDSVNRKILLGYVFEYSRDDKAHESGMMFFSTWLKFRGFTLPSHPEN